MCENWSPKLTYFLRILSALINIDDSNKINIKWILSLSGRYRAFYSASSAPCAQGATNKIYWKLSSDSYPAASGDDRHDERPAAAEGKQISWKNYVPLVAFLTPPQTPLWLIIFCGALFMALSESFLPCGFESNEADLIIKDLLDSIDRFVHFCLCKLYFLLATLWSKSTFSLPSHPLIVNTLRTRNTRGFSTSEFAFNSFNSCTRR